MCYSVANYQILRGQICEVGDELQFFVRPKFKNHVGISMNSYGFLSTFVSIMCSTPHADVSAVFYLPHWSTPHRHNHDNGGPREHGGDQKMQKCGLQQV